MHDPLHHPIFGLNVLLCFGKSIHLVTRCRVMWVSQTLHTINSHSNLELIKILNKVIEIKFSLSIGYYSDALYPVIYNICLEVIRDSANRLSL